ncbi:MAG: alpha/beta hydrolase-fold protein [Butyrivibrio sp.]|nr:alpha/beta hydrolase-fold protein [Acetatifactor muris]MCM1559761.1 alpha/beta hydrolase-fold protein [Butyrivibrio sp.]
MDLQNCIQLAAAGKNIDIYPCAVPDRPVIYFNTVSEEKESVLEELKKTDCPDFSLVAISNLEWTHDMSPWDIPPISPGDTPCTGGADTYLSLFINEIIPKVEKNIKGVSRRGITGYSLAGLFALYSMYRTDLFSLIASISGSLWFPGFQEYAMSHEPKKRPECVYISLGDRECKTKNPYLRSVQANTEALVDFYRRQQIDTEFRLNPGGHFTEPARRTAMGIRWLVTS